VVIGSQAVGHGPLAEQRGPASANVLEDRASPHDIQVRVLLTREGSRRHVLRCCARSDGIRGLDPEPRERVFNRRRQILRHRDLLDGPANVHAQRANRVLVVGREARQPIESTIHEGRFRQNPPERIRRDAEARRHADALDAQQLAHMRALAAGNGDLRLVDLLEIHQLAMHSLAPLCRRVFTRPDHCRHGGSEARQADRRASGLIDLRQQ